MLTTSAAEVLVCWSALATTVAALRPSFRPAHARMLAVVPGSLLFGCYHVAHSPPFDSSPMIALLTGVGVATGLVFALTGDVHGAILFHSFLALFGVLEAVDRSGGTTAYAVMAPSLAATATVTVLVTATLRWVVRRAVSDASRTPRAGGR